MACRPASHDRRRRGRQHDRQRGAGVRGLPHATGHGRDDRQEHRRPAERPASVGLVPGRLPAHVAAPRTAARSATRRTTTSPAPRSATTRPHHEPFQYYASTANPHHLPPSPIGDDRPRRPGQPPVRPRATSGPRRSRATCRRSVPQGRRRTRTATPGYSDPLDEQTFLVETLNRLQQLPSGASTAVVLPYDDSDGWYDHVDAAARQQLADRQLTRSTAPASAAPPRRPGRYQGRCGSGPRLPLLVISPYAKQLRRPHADRPDVGPALHRGQLAARAYRRRLLRRARRAADQHVRLQRAQRRDVPRSGDRLARAGRRRRGRPRRVSRGQV